MMRDRKRMTRQLKKAQAYFAKMQTPVHNDDKYTKEEDKPEYHSYELDRLSK